MIKTTPSTKKVAFAILEKQLRFEIKVEKWRLRKILELQRKIKKLEIELEQLS